MKNNETKKVGIGVDGHKQTKFNLSRDINTSMTWGDCEPLLCELMLPNSKMKVKASNLTRLAPLVAPCFGRMHYKTLSMFVPIHEIYPAFEAMMTGQSITQQTGVNSSTVVPTSVPQIQSNILTLLCLIGADVRVWRGETADNSSAPASVSDVVNWKIFTSGSISTAITNAFSNSLTVANKPDNWRGLSSASCYSGSYLLGASDGLAGPYIPCYVPSGISSRFCKDSSITPDNADLVVFDKFGGTFNPATSPINGYTFAFCFRFSDVGKRYAKLLRGLGYNLDMSDSSYVSLLPLMAYYRVYWEAFGIRRYQNFESTNLYKLIQRWRYAFRNQVAKTDSDITNTGSDSVIWSFFRDLGEMWYTDAPDYVSAQQMRPVESIGVNGSSAAVSIFNTGFLDVTSDIFGMTSGIQSDNTSAYPHTVKVEHSQLSSELLKIGYKWTNRQTVLGGDIEKQLKAMGEGQYIDECRIPFIGATTKQISVMDVSATADTFEAATDTTQQKGMVLGQYAGKACEYDEGKAFEWSTDKYGYWITMAMVVPEGGFCQQVDRRNYAVDRWGFYQPEFDGLGYQPTTMKEIVGSPVGSYRGDSAPSGFIGSAGDTFGYIPRNSEWKIGRNVINGDFALNSVKDTYAPYYLDRLIEVGTVSSSETSNSGGVVTRTVNRSFFDYTKLPKAGNAWRYNSRFPWLSQYNRIFANFSGSFADIGGLSAGASSIISDVAQRTDENFICHNVILIDYYAPMKPLALSYGTYDEEKGANGAEVKA